MLYKVYPGLDTILFPPDGSPTGPIILGEEGRGRRRTVVPVVGSGEFVTHIGGKVVAGARKEADECLVWVKTDGGYSRGREYDMIAPHGVTVLASGVGREGTAGRVGGWMDYLVRLDHEGGFRLRGKYGDEVVVLNLGGRVECAPAAKIEAWRTEALMKAATPGGLPVEALLKILTPAQKETIALEAALAQRPARRYSLVQWAASLGLTEKQLVSVEAAMGLPPFVEKAARRR